MAVRAGLALAVAAATLAACSTADGDTPLPGGPATAAATSVPTPSGPAGPSRPGDATLVSGPVRLVLRPQDAARRPLLQSYLDFFAAYADALGKADAGSAALRGHTTPEAFADFARGLAENARTGVTVRGPVTLRPALRPVGSGALTAVLVDCLDASGQKFYDRSGTPTGQAGDRRPIQVELVDSPGPVRWLVGSVADGPATACERSGS